jgi:hypothetical protein
MKETFTAHKAAEKTMKEETEKKKQDEVSNVLTLLAPSLSQLLSAYTHAHNRYYEILLCCCYATLQHWNRCLVGGC